MRLLPLLLALSCAGLATARADERADRAERVRTLRARDWTLTAVRVEGPLAIDGRVDDAAWARATPASEFYQNEKHEGLPASERTEVRVLYDDDTLYIGIRCFDARGGDAVKALSLFRDENSGDDLVLVAIDAFHDHRSAVQFVTNANGYMVDSLQTGETTATRNQDWDTVWDARASRTAEGWDAELAIPFRSLRFEEPPPGQPLVFGIGFKRNLPRRNEESTWPFVPNDSSWYRPSELGHLVGLEGVRPGKSLDLRPYALVGARRDGAASTTLRRDAGLDLKWGIGSGLTADFTVNTDFAQEEVDTLQTNFTRFSLFLPEKRQFFLENQRMFQFGVPAEIDLVFTRRIGLSEAGEVIPLRGGGRLSGRVGRTSIGAMSLQTGAGAGRDSENFTVLRVRRDVLGRSSVGALVTSRTGEAANRVAGVDATFLFRNVWAVEGFYARLTDERRPGARHAAYGRAAYDTDRLGATYRVLDVDDGFTPGVGFVRRPDSREQFGDLRYSPRPRIGVLRQLHTSANLRYTTSQAGVLETRERGGRVEAALETGDTVALEFLDRFEFLDRAFALRPGVEVAPGTYRFQTVTARVNTFRRRRARVNLSAARGGFWGGDRDTIVADGYYRMTKHFGTSLRYEVNWFDLPRARFVSQVASGRVEIAFNRDTVLLSLLQYSPDTRRLSANVRFNWIPKPGTDVFLVYSEVDELRRPAVTSNRSIVAKLNYLFAF